VTVAVALTDGYALAFTVAAVLCLAAAASSGIVPATEPRRLHDADPGS
jgi:hypothetical protein